MAHVLPAPMPRCAYCVAIRQHRRKNPLRPARHDRDGAVPRCDRHWRYLCAVCGRARHFHGMAWCPDEDRLFCLHCAPAHRRKPGRFWGGGYAYRLRCPWRKGWHVALDRAEHEGNHPWQAHPSRARTQWGLAGPRSGPVRWTFTERPIGAVSDTDVRRAWDGLSGWWDGHYSEKGDVNREWLLDPLLLDWLGDVRGRRVLDAGCGAGYLSRILASRGASVDGVDLSPKMIQLAKAKEQEAPSGARFRVGNLSKLSGFPAGHYDAAVSNVVLQDVRDLRGAVRSVARVLRPGGRFLFSVTHPAYEPPVADWVVEPPDSERVEDRRHKTADRYFDRSAVWFRPPGGGRTIPGFHRPLRDYFEALHAAGLAVTRLEEPRPSAQVLRERWRLFADVERLPLFLVVEAGKAGQR